MSKDAATPAAPAVAATAPATIRPSDMPEPAAQAPTPRKAKASAGAEPAFSDGGPAEPHDPGVMTVNPTPRDAPPRHGGGPTPLMGEDLARRGGGPDQRVDDRQGAMAEKFRKDPAIQKLMKDEALKRFGEMPGDGPGSAGERGGAPAAVAPAAPAAPAAVDPNAPARASASDDVAEIAKQQRENRELKQRIKLAEGSRTEAARLSAWKQIAKDFPIAAMKEVLGIEPDHVYQDDVQQRSSKADPERLKVDPAALIADEDKRAGADVERDELRRRATAAEQELALERSTRGAARVAQEDGKRWELCNRDPDIGQTVVREVQRLFAEADKDAGGHGKGWRPKDDAEAKEFTQSILDDLEKNYESLGKRYSRQAAAPAAEPSQRPKPPANQRPGGTAPTAPIGNYRYEKAPKRESVEDRQDRLIERYRGVSLTDADS